MSAKRQSPDANESESNRSATEQAPNLREPARSDDFIIKVFDRDCRKHRLNWTRLLQIAPETCLNRLFDLDGEANIRTQVKDCPGWFMNALCSYVNDTRKDAMFMVEEEHAEAVVRIFNNLRWVPSEHEIAINPMLVSLLHKASESFDVTGAGRLIELSRTAASLCLELIKEISAVPSRLQIPEAHMRRITLSTRDHLGVAIDNLACRLYRTVKLLGPYALDPSGDGTYRFSARPKEPSSTFLSIECHIYDVQAGKEGGRFHVSYTLDISLYEDAQIENPF